MFGAVTAGAAIALALSLPLAWKWQLGMRRSIAGLAAIAVVVAAAVVGLAEAVDVDSDVAGPLATVLTLLVAGAVVLWRFYRDPDRTAPEREDVILSPADGEVVYVNRSRAGELPVATKEGRPYVLDELVRTPLQAEDATVVGIALSFLDVHVNRAPITGTVTFQERHPGSFASLKDTHAVFANERATTVLERPGLEVAVVMIASRLVRRIVSYVRAGDGVTAGQRIGVIRFGSQVDVVLPAHAGVRVLVDPGQRLVAGETVVAEAAVEGAGAPDVGAEPLGASGTPER